MRFACICLVVILVTGCAGLTRRGPTDEELVSQLMREWVEGWNTLDADRLAPLMSESYYGANGENKEELLTYVRQWKQNPENQVVFSMEQAVILVTEDRATVRGILADINIKESEIIGQFKLDYFLQKEEGAWRITGAVLAS